MPCTAPSIPLLEAFRPVFTAPSWKKMLTLLRGTLLAHGRRTVTTALWHTGHEQDPHFSGFHQVLNRARWSPLQASRYLLTLIMQTFVQAGGTLDIVIDETLERRWGPKIRKRGHYRDSALSSHARSVSSPGLRWIVLAVVVSVPWTRQRWALPFLCVLATTPEVSAHLGIPHKTLGQWARQVVSLLRRWLPGAPIKLMGDMAYSILELGLHCTHQQITLIAPLRLDSVLHQPAPVRTPHTIGRPRVVGPRLPSLEHLLSDPQIVWERLILDWYGEGERTLELCSGVACWYRFGSAPLPIRWVLTRDPRGKRPPKALFSTDQTQSPEAIVRDFMKRWSLETTFEESSAHLGIETQRQWSDRAIERTTPLLFGLYSLVALFGAAVALMGILPSGGRVGITSQPRPLAIFWRWCGGASGGASIFPQPGRTPMSFLCLVRQLRNWLMRSATEQKMYKVELSTTATDAW